jgi:hypothetical protein
MIHESHVHAVKVEASGALCSRGTALSRQPCKQEIQVKCCMGLVVTAAHTYTGIVVNIRAS